MYDNYISILKLVVGIAAMVFVFIDLLSYVSKPVEGSFTMLTEFIASTLSSAFNGIVYGFLWVTAVFVILEKAGLGEGNLTLRKQKWTVNDLPPLSVSAKDKISRGETAVGLFFTVLFTALLVAQPHIIGWYEKKDTGLALVAPFFNIGQLQAYIFVIVLLAIVQFVMSIYKFIVMRWNLPLAIVNAANNIALVILAYVMFNDSSLINTGFVSRFAEAVNAPAAKVMTSYHSFLTVFIVVFIIACAIDSIMGFIKSRRISLPSIKLS